jgi:hypothetical protein
MLTTEANTMNAVVVLEGIIGMGDLEENKFPATLLSPHEY